MDTVLPNAENNKNRPAMASDNSAGARHRCPFPKPQGGGNGKTRKGGHFGRHGFARKSGPMSRNIHSVSWRKKFKNLLDRFFRKGSSSFAPRGAFPSSVSPTARRSPFPPFSFCSSHGPFSPPPAMSFTTRSSPARTIRSPTPALHTGACWARSSNTRKNLPPSPPTWKTTTS